MHEFSVMSGVVEALLKELEHLEKKGGKEIQKVNEVILEVGELTFLGDEQIRFCYDILCEKSKLAGSKLNILKVQAEVHCKECGYTGGVNYYREFHLETPILSCPECKSTVEIMRGRECAIKSMNIEVKDEE